MIQNQGPIAASVGDKRKPATAAPWSDICAVELHRAWLQATAGLMGLKAMVVQAWGLSSALERSVRNAGQRWFEA